MLGRLRKEADKSFPNLRRCFILIITSAESAIKKTLFKTYRQPSYDRVISGNGNVQRSSTCCNKNYRPGFFKQRVSATWNTLLQTPLFLQDVHWWSERSETSPQYGFFFKMSCFVGYEVIFNRHLELISKVAAEEPKSEKTALRMISREPQHISNIERKEYMNNFQKAIGIFALHYQCLDSTVQSTISTWSSPFDYLFLDPIVIEKANRLTSFKFGNIQLLNVLHFLEGSWMLILRLEDTKKTQSVCSQWLVQLPILDESNQNSLSRDFYNSLRYCNPLENEYQYHEKPTNSITLKKFALAELKLSEVTSIGTEIYHYLVKVCEDEKVQSC